MIELVPYWEETADDPYLDGFWLRCVLHGDIKYFELNKRPVNFSDIQEIEQEHMNALHFP